MIEIPPIVGLDLSLSCTGYCLFKEGHYSSKAITTILKNNSRIERCLDITRQIREASPASAIFFIEDYAYSIRNGSALAQLGELNGLVRSMIYAYSGKKPIPVNISTWKKFISGKGTLKKDAFKLEIYKRFNIECKTNDEAVAIALAYFGQHLYAYLKNKTISDSLLSYQKEIIKKFKINEV